MARKRLESSGLKTWGDADNTLLDIGRLERQIEQEEATLQESIAQAKEATAARVKQLQAQIKGLDAQLQVFAQGHQEDFDGKKSKTINFGEVGFQYSTKVIIPRKKEAVQAVVEKLKALKLRKCILVKETPIKDEIKKLDEATLKQLAPLGVRKEGKDTFWRKVFREKILEAAA